MLHCHTAVAVTRGWFRCSEAHPRIFFYSPVISSQWSR